MAREPDVTGSISSLVPGYTMTTTVFDRPSIAPANCSVRPLCETRIAPPEWYEGRTTSRLAKAFAAFTVLFVETNELEVKKKSVPLPEATQNTGEAVSYQPARYISVMHAR